MMLDSCQNLKEIPKGKSLKFFHAELSYRINIKEEGDDVKNLHFQVEMELNGDVLFLTYTVIVGSMSSIKNTFKKSGMMVHRFNTSPKKAEGSWNKNVWEISDHKGKQRTGINQRERKTPRADPGELRLGRKMLRSNR